MREKRKVLEKISSVSPYEMRTYDPPYCNFIQPFPAQTPSDAPSERTRVSARYPLYPWRAYMYGTFESVLGVIWTVTERREQI